MSWPPHKPPRDSQMPILIFIMVVAVLLGLAGYGYMTGAWEQPP